MKQNTAVPDDFNSEVSFALDFWSLFISSQFNSQIPALFSNNDHPKDDFGLSRKKPSMNSISKAKAGQDARQNPEVQFFKQAEAYGKNSLIRNDLYMQERESVISLVPQRSDSHPFKQKEFGNDLKKKLLSSRDSFQSSNQVGEIKIIQRQNEQKIVEVETNTLPSFQNGQTTDKIQQVNNGSKLNRESILQSVRIDTEIMNPSQKIRSPEDNRFSFSNKTNSIQITSINSADAKIKSMANQAKPQENLVNPEGFKTNQKLPQSLFKPIENFVLDKKLALSNSKVINLPPEDFIAQSKIEELKRSLEVVDGKQEQNIGKYLPNKKEDPNKPSELARSKMMNYEHNYLSNRPESSIFSRLRYEASERKHTPVEVDLKDSKIITAVGKESNAMQLFKFTHAEEAQANLKSMKMSDPISTVVHTPDLHKNVLMLSQSETVTKTLRNQAKIASPSFPTKILQPNPETSIKDKELMYQSAEKRGAFPKKQSKTARLKEMVAKESQRFKSEIEDIKRTLNYVSSKNFNGIGNTQSYSTVQIDKDKFYMN